ncbi:MAG: Sec-independent protein translocase protein TatB [Pseudorhodobacter sp.]|nr:Sec-independent protein translocase protein TatB [Pseudorhodobacter sp.]
MFDIGWTELLLIGVVALIVIGPKDLPGMFRTMGRFTAKARSMARDFQRAMESAADEAGVKDVAKDLKSMTSAKSMGLDALKGAASKFEAFDPLKTKPGDVVRQAAASITAPAPAPAPAPAAAAAAAPAAAVAKGPATQALADAQAARRAARAEAAVATADPATADPAPAPPERAAVKSTRAAKTAKTAEVVRAALEGKRPARKPAAPTGEA